MRAIVFCGHGSKGHGHHVLIYLGQEERFPLNGVEIELAVSKPCFHMILSMRCWGRRLVGLGLDRSHLGAGCGYAMAPALDGVLHIAIRTLCQPQHFGVSPLVSWAQPHLKHRTIIHPEPGCMGVFRQSWPSWLAFQRFLSGRPREYNSCFSSSVSSGSATRDLNPGSDNRLRIIASFASSDMASPSNRLNCRSNSKPAIFFSHRSGFFDNIFRPAPRNCVTVFKKSHGNVPEPVRI